MKIIILSVFVILVNLSVYVNCDAVTNETISSTVLPSSNSVTKPESESSPAPISTSASTSVSTSIPITTSTDTSSPVESSSIRGRAKNVNDIDTEPIYYRVYRPNKTASILYDEGQYRVARRYSNRRAKFIFKQRVGK